MEGKRIIRDRRQQQNQNEDRLAPPVEQKASDQQNRLLGERTGRQQVQRVDGTEERSKRWFVEEHRRSYCGLSEWGPADFLPAIGMWLSRAASFTRVRRSQEAIFYRAAVTH